MFIVNIENFLTLGKNFEVQNQQQKLRLAKKVGIYTRIVLVRTFQRGIYFGGGRGFEIQRDF